MVIPCEWTSEFFGNNLRYFVWDRVSNDDILGAIDCITQELITILHRYIFYVYGVIGVVSELILVDID